MYEIIYYKTTRGEDVVKEFLHGLEERAQVKAYARLALLAEKGPDLKRPYADTVRGKIRELRMRFIKTQIRILYFFHDRRIILLDGFKKDEAAIRPEDLDRAEQRMMDWLDRRI